MLPKKLPKKKYQKGTPTIGEAIFIVSFGMTGANLKKSI